MGSGFGRKLGKRQGAQASGLAVDPSAVAPRAEAEGVICHLRTIYRFNSQTAKTLTVVVSQRVARMRADDRLSEANPAFAFAR